MFCHFNPTQIHMVIKVKSGLCVSRSNVSLISKKYDQKKKKISKTALLSQNSFVRQTGTDWVLRTRGRAVQAQLLFRPRLLVLLVLVTS